MAFRMISRAAGELHYLLVEPTYPSKLFRLTDTSVDVGALAEEIKDDCRHRSCMMDDFTKKHLLVHPDVGSSDSTTSLQVLGNTVRTGGQQHQCHQKEPDLNTAAISR